PFPSGPSNTPPSFDSILQIDFTYDFKTDLVLAGAGGVRLLRQESPSAFTDVTAEAKLPANVAGAAYTGAWSADIEADGDLDIVLGSKQGSPTVLRNNGDGTFVEIHPFPASEGISGFVWADFDQDGDPDAAVLTPAGVVQVFNNERQGQFSKRVSLIDFQARAISVADVNWDGNFDLLIVQANGTISRWSDKDHGASEEQVVIGSLSSAAPAGPLSLRVADIDNNGGLDLLLLGPRPEDTLIWLSDKDGKLSLRKDIQTHERVLDVADVNADGRLDLLGFSPEGQPVQSLNSGSKNYHLQ